MQKTALDFSQCATRRALHEKLAEQLGFPEHYGRNLDALWDCLTEPTGEERILTLSAVPDFSRGEPGLREYFSELLQVLEEAAKENPCIRFCRQDSCAI